MNKKKVLSFAMAACMLSGTMAYAENIPDVSLDLANPIVISAQNNNTSEELNGATIPSVTFKEVNGIKMIPLRSVCEELGYTVTWRDESRKIELIKGAQFITMGIDVDSYAFSRRAPQSLGAAPTLIGESTYVPVNFIDEIIGGYTEMNEDGTCKIVVPSIVTVTSVENDGSIVVFDEHLGIVVIRIDENTVITADGKAAKAEDIKADMVLGVEYSPVMALSEPPLNTAVKINIENQPEDVAPETALTFEGKITEIEDNLVTIGVPHEDANALRLVITDETIIKHGMDKRIYKLDDLKVGMTISGTHDEAMTFSIPAQTVALTVNIETDIEGNEDYIAAEGVISEITEDGLVIIKRSNDDKYGVALVITDETVIKHGMDRRIYKADDLEVGMKINVKYSKEMTKSLPAQSTAFEIDIAD